ncbi:hypothetical protein [Aquimixticola soesokkakensis]|uniref:hypothetical protein n=1 Tax=Aquimixticola soesokkakensis TaxID=1519096 RepID=UPI00117757D5|nr:hypothetical protein [Aquimixticola soesokkakensis]
MTFFALSLLAACSAGPDAVTSEQTVGPFTYQVSVSGTNAVARNFHTGRLNFAELQENAVIAIERASGCSLRTIVKRGELNTFDATLSCAS